MSTYFAINAGIGIRKVGLLCLLLPLAFSCASLGGSNKGDAKDFETAVEAFNGALRWGDFKAAAVWISPTLKESFWSLVDKIEGDVAGLNA